MSYCRIGPDSDVYVIVSGAVYAVTVVGGDYYTFVKLSDLYNCLERLSSEGYKVPERVFKRIRSEQS